MTNNSKFLLAFSTLSQDGKVVLQEHDQNKIITTWKIALFSRFILTGIIGDQLGESVFRYLFTHVKSILKLKIIMAAVT